ncbi:MAG TPA: hypothetical protein VK968_13440 [Roseimicrobium sp.]|nr:hypothetical protein [Roseimicrobium sp.]
MPHDYVPRQDTEFLLWVDQLTATLSAEREAYGVPVAAVDQLVAANQEFAEAMAALTPGMRCASYVQRKNDARRVVETIARQCVKVVVSRPEVSAEMRNAIRVSLRGRGGFNGRRKRPDAAPRVMVRSVSGPVVTVWMIDRESGRHARPHGVELSVVFVATGESIDETTDWQFAGVGSVTLAIDVSRFRLRPGERVWVRACWQNDRGIGPASDPVATRVMDGMVMPSVAA